MPYVQRRRLEGVTTKRVSLLLTVESYEGLQGMKGKLSNSAAVERLIAEKRARLERRQASQEAGKGPGGCF